MNSSWTIERQIRESVIKVVMDSDETEAIITLSEWDGSRFCYDIDFPHRERFSKRGVDVETWEELEAEAVRRAWTELISNPI